MLSSNEPTVGDIVSFKLTSGEEVVGKIIERTIDSVFIAKPVQIVMQQLGPKQVGLAFMPVLGSVSDVMSLRFPFNGMAIRPTRTGDDVIRNYLQATTGILAPTAEQTSIITAP